MHNNNNKNKLMKYSPTLYKSPSVLNDVIPFLYHKNIYIQS
jgi:hypothetical protein